MVSYERKELFNLREHMSSQPFVGEVCVAHLFSSPPLFGEICVAHLLSFLCLSLFFVVCLMLSVSLVLNNGSVLFSLTYYASLSS